MNKTSLDFWADTPELPLLHPDSIRFLLVDWSVQINRDEFHVAFIQTELVERDALTRQNISAT